MQTDIFSTQICFTSLKLVCGNEYKKMFVTLIKELCISVLASHDSNFNQNLCWSETKVIIKLISTS